MRRIVFYLPILVMVPAICLGQDEAARPETEVFLDPGIVFTLKGGESVEIDGGIYRLRAAGPDSLQLRLGDEDFEIEAEPLELEEDVLGTGALSFEDEAGVQHLVIAQPDGTVLSSIGRREPEVEQRGAATTSYVTADRTKAVMAAIEPVRRPYSNFQPKARVIPPVIQVQKPSKGEEWITCYHAERRTRTSLACNKFEIRWLSRDGQKEQVGDKVQVSLVNVDGKIPQGGFAQANDGSAVFLTNHLLSPGDYQVVVASVANSAVFGRSQPFKILAAPPCVTGGTIVACKTIYHKGYQKHYTDHIGPAGNQGKFWITEDLAFQNGGANSEARLARDDGLYRIDTSTPGYVSTGACSWAIGGCAKHPSVIAKTYYLHYSQ